MSCRNENTKFEKQQGGKKKIIG